MTSYNLSIAARWFMWSISKTELVKSSLKSQVYHNVASYSCQFTLPLYFCPIVSFPLVISQTSHDITTVICLAFLYTNILCSQKAVDDIEPMSTEGEIMMMSSCYTLCCCDVIMFASDTQDQCLDTLVYVG